MASWNPETVNAISATDDLRIAPFRVDGVTHGTPTWIWSVVVDDRLYVRPYHGARSRWYQAAIAQRAGQISTAGTTYDVTFIPATDPDLNDRVDAAYRDKYAGNAFLAPMIAAGPRSATVEVRPV